MGDSTKRGGDSPHAGFRHIAIMALFAGSLLAAGSALADLVDRGNGLIYDTDLNVTFLADANYAKTSGWPAAQINNGKVTRAQAQAWVDQLVYAGYDDWRLPKTDWCGTNWNCAGGEIAHLYYAEVFSPPFGFSIYCSSMVRTESGDDRWFQSTGGPEYCQWASSPPGGPILFTVADCMIGQEACWFWTQDPAPNPFPGTAGTWIFTYHGAVSTSYTPDDLNFAWAVRDGDVNQVLDSDGDGVNDDSDNCRDIGNTNQTDNDSDGTGDVCDDDDDDDLILDGSDNCPLIGNASQGDFDGDGIGNVCDSDLDGDGFDNAFDNCPSAANVDQTDTDADGLGDECDLNDDGDAWADAADNCPSIPNDGQEDLDGDGIGDFCDADLDGDGHVNETDNCPIDANVPQDDADGDGQGDACDGDDDGDGVRDTADNCPLLGNPGQSDLDHDGSGDACDGDLDGDGSANAIDNCPVAANPDQRDLDGDGQGDACDADIDGDGAPNTSDACAGTAGGEVTDASGCSIAQLAPCSGPAGTVTPWRNHGKYVAATAQAARRFRETGLLSPAQVDAVVSSAAQGTCGGP